jgi:hypothetical protein
MRIYLETILWVTILFGLIFLLSGCRTITCNANPTAPECNRWEQMWRQ